MHLFTYSDTYTHLKKSIEGYSESESQLQAGGRNKMQKWRKL